MAGKIFINYRRDDSIGTAGRLHDRLAEAFGRKNLFMDVDHIPAGVDYSSYLNAQVAVCEIFLAVIGPRWLDAKDERGNRRLDNPDDFVSLEIAAALNRDIRVIPVLVDGAHMPKAADVPDSLKPLVRRNAVEVRNALFGRDAEALVKKVREAFGDRGSDQGWRRVVAASVLVLLCAGWIGLYFVGIPKWLPWGAPRESSHQAEADTARKVSEEPARKAQEEVARKAQEEAARRAQEEAARRAQEEAVRKAQEEAVRKAQEEAIRKARENSIKAEEEAAAMASAQATPAGWSVDVKPKRVILSYAPEKDGPRYLIVACLRDSEEIGIYSAGIGAPSSRPVVVMVLTNAGRKYSVRGDMGIDNLTNQPAFRYETNIDSRALEIFRAEFMPMLSGKGPLSVTIGDKLQQVPLTGVAEPLRKFSAACFGKA